MKNKAYIELHTDNNYVIATVVTITSLLKNKNKDSKYEIRVLGNNLTPENIKLIEKTGVKVIPHQSSFSKFEGTHLFVSSTDLFKFDLADALSDWDKVLYLDTDMIIQGDLSELFGTDLGDNYVAAVKDMAGMVSENHHNRIGHLNYFNAGMMLLNLKKMREDNIRDKLIDYKLNKDSGHFMSQDALNVVFDEKVVYLHPKYNFMAPNMQSYKDQQVCEFYDISQNEYKNMKTDATILHLTNQKKPWNFKEIYGSELWHKYYKCSVCRHIPINYQDCLEPTFLGFRKSKDRKFFYFAWLPIFGFKAKKVGQLAVYLFGIKIGMKKGVL